MTLVLVCARTLSKDSNLEIFTIEAKEEIAKTKRLIKSMGDKEEDGVRKRLFVNCFKLIESAEKAISKGDRKAVLLGKSLLKKASTYCKVISDSYKWI